MAGLGARLSRLTDIEIAEVLRPYPHWDRRQMLNSWFAAARPSQLPPEGDWRVWLIMAGRGFGKTRSGAEWVRVMANLHVGARIAIVGATLHEARSVMVEGKSGLLAVGPRKQRPRFEPSLRRLTWPNGSLGLLYSADEPESLRGAEHSHAWGDEIAKWPRGIDTWTNLSLGLRLGQLPRAVLTTTPRPVPLLKTLLGDRSVVRTGGHSADNADNLPPAFLRSVEASYGGTRYGRQELGGELIEDFEGALWTRALIERCRTPAAAAEGERAPGFSRVVVGVDPPAGEGASAAACGIVVAGLASGVAVVIEDASVQGLAPEAWARAVVDAAERHRADRIIAEVNNGGAMVTSVLRAVDNTLPVKAVRASRGKVARAEPVAALYEAGRVKHAGAFPSLEDEMCGLIAGGAYAGPGGSPDRADALVWAVSELLLARRWWPGVRGI